MTQADFARRVEEGRSRFTLIAQEIARTAAGILAERAALEKKLNSLGEGFSAGRGATCERSSRACSRPAGSPRTPWERLQHLPRYLKAASLRLDKLRADPAARRAPRRRGRARSSSRIAARVGRARAQRRA